MAVKIGHASIDERRKATGGKAGDQTAKEVCTTTWYSNGWTVLLRPKRSTVAEKMAKFCEAVCANSKIGYDQYQRNTLREKAKAAGWNAGKITTACETDCSAFMTVCAEAAGVDVSGCYTNGNAPTTGTMRAKFKATGDFEVLTDSKYLKSSDYLERGDILVKEPGHTIMVLSNGAKVKKTSEALAFKVGDVVKFTGSKHYANANATSGVSCKAGKAKVTAISKGSKHPYHLIAVSGSGSTVYGWVDEAAVKKIGEISVGDVVQFTGSKHYTSADAKTGKACKAGKAEVTAISKGSKHPYHLKKVSGSTSTVYGWVDADKVSK